MEVPAGSVGRVSNNHMLNPTDKHNEMGATFAVACPMCTYKPVAANMDCVLCPANSSALTGSAARSDCRCVANYFGDAQYGECTACPNGGTIAAQSLPIATVASDCASTPPTQSATPVASAECAAGYGGTDGGATCIPCATGTDKPAGGNAACKNRPAGKNAAAGSIICDSS